MHRYLRLQEVIAELDVDPAFLEQLEAEGLIHPRRTLEGEVVLSLEEVDRVRLARLLVYELEVNLPGVEVVVHMREEMLAMRRQFSEILERLVSELRRRLEEK
jgi:MerR family transcriptional regulator/heat shock protein HspR